MGKTGRGKRAGSRRGTRPPRRFRRDVALLALATTIAVVAWGYLVYAAIDFGGDARSGETRAWGFLALAAVGAAACLFAALMLIARVLRALAAPAPPTGGNRSPGASPEGAPARHEPHAAPPRHAGGHRAD